MTISDEEMMEEFGLSEEDLNKGAASKEEAGTEEAETLGKPEPTKQEIEATDLGWVSQEDWVKSGKDAEDWRNAKTFLDFNKLAKSVDEKVNKVRQESQEEIKHLNKFHELQLLDTVKQLIAARSNAVETGDVEEFNKIEARLEELKKQVNPAPQTERPQAIIDWENSNTWCQNPNDERTILANALFSATKAINPNMTMNDRLKYVDDNLALKFPKTNARREQPANNEPSRKTPTKTTYTINDLTPVERQQYEKFGRQFWDNEIDFIKAAIAARTK